MKDRYNPYSNLILLFPSSISFRRCGEQVLSKNSKYTLLPRYSKYAKNLRIIATCDGASSVSQVGNEVASILTKKCFDKVRMCFLAAVVAGSELHLRIFRDTRAVIAINGCFLICVSNILRKKGIELYYEVTTTEMGAKRS